jgi:hypothetical protein
MSRRADLEVTFDTLWTAWLAEARREGIRQPGEPFDLQQAAARKFGGPPGGPYPASVARATLEAFVDAAVAADRRRRPRFYIALGQLVVDPLATGSVDEAARFVTAATGAHDQAIVAESELLGIARAARRSGVSERTVDRLRAASPRRQKPASLAPAPTDSRPNPLARRGSAPIVDVAGSNSCSGPATAGDTA